MDKYLTGSGFRRSDFESTLYTRKSKDGNMLIVSLYVDDLLVTGSREVQMSKFKTEM